MDNTLLVVKIPAAVMKALVLVLYVGWPRARMCGSLRRWDFLSRKLWSSHTLFATLCWFLSISVRSVISWWLLFSASWMITSITLPWPGVESWLDSLLTSKQMDCVWLEFWVVLSMLLSQTLCLFECQLALTEGMSLILALLLFCQSTHTNGRHAPPGKHAWGLCRWWWDQKLWSQCEDRGAIFWICGLRGFDWLSMASCNMGSRSITAVEVLLSCNWVSVKGCKLK